MWEEQTRRGKISQSHGADLIVRDKRMSSASRSSHTWIQDAVYAAIDCGALCSLLVAERRNGAASHRLLKKISFQRDAMWEIQLNKDVSHLRSVSWIHTAFSHEIQLCCSLSSVWIHISRAEDTECWPRWWQQRHHGDIWSPDFFSSCRLASEQFR